MRYYATFGVQYPREPHPAGPWVTCRGWVEVEAADEGQARARMIEVFGQKWSMLYDEAEWVSAGDPARWFPAGCLATLDEAACETCEGAGWLPEHHDHGAVERLGCPDCQGAGRAVRLVLS